mmetsp:Transcript_39970/g.90625  ORF Transcript_39970/g.90625 Transcript_39970/m.90625 type:complete len:241 (-) Transcript_39970:1423-2145(-)
MDAAHEPLWDGAPPLPRLAGASWRVLQISKLGREREVGDVAEGRLHVRLSSGGDDADDVVGVRTQGLEAVEYGRGGREGLPCKVLKVLQVCRDLLLLDESPVQAEHDEAARGGGVGALDRLDRESRQRPSVAKREGALGVLHLCRADAAHILHCHFEPGCSRVLADEVVVFRETGGALCDGHRKGRVQLLHHVVKIERVDANASVEHMAAAHKLRKNDHTARLYLSLSLHCLGEDILEWE